MNKRSFVWRFLIIYILLWVVVSCLRSPSLDSYGDMVENFAWGQTWEWGSFKHPPLFAWIVKIWFFIWPKQVWAYYLLSYANAAIGILGIAALLKWWLPENLTERHKQAVVNIAVVLAAVSFPYANLAAKFNADTVLLSLWPWTAYAFFRSLHQEKGKTYAVLLGILAAGCMLGKYYSGVLLASLFLVSLMIKEFVTWYKTPRPYIALAVMVLLLLPHGMWEYAMGFPFRQYLNGKLQSGIEWKRMVVFMLSAVFYWPFAWLAYGCLKNALHDRVPVMMLWRYPRKVMYVLTVLPVLLTLIAHLLTGIHITTHWAIPVWYALPVCLALLLAPQLSEGLPERFFRRGLWIMGVLVLLGGVAVAAILAYRGSAKYYYSRQAMVETVQAAFEQEYPQVTIGWVGGTWPEPASFAFFLDGHPRALPGMPDEMPALVNPHPDWFLQYGLIMCEHGGYGHVAHRDESCESRTVAWLGKHHLPVKMQTLTYRAKGWRYPLSQEKAVTVFWVEPKRM